MDGPGERALNHGSTFRSLPPPRIPAPDSITPGILASHTSQEQGVPLRTTGSLALADIPVFQYYLIFGSSD
jgi:hypothetical protein